MSEHNINLSERELDELLIENYVALFEDKKEGTKKALNFLLGKGNKIKKIAKKWVKTKEEMLQNKYEPMIQKAKDPDSISDTEEEAYKDKMETQQENLSNLEDEINSIADPENGGDSRIQAIARKALAVAKVKGSEAEQGYLKRVISAYKTAKKDYQSLEQKVKDIEDAKKGYQETVDNTDTEEFEKAQKQKKDDDKGDEKTTKDDTGSNDDKTDSDDGDPKDDTNDNDEGDSEFESKKKELVDKGYTETKPEDEDSIEDTQKITNDDGDVVTFYKTKEETSENEQLQERLMLQEKLRLGGLPTPDEMRFLKS